MAKDFTILSRGFLTSTQNYLTSNQLIHVIGSTCNDASNHCHSLTSKDNDSSPKDIGQSSGDREAHSGCSALQYVNKLISLFLCFIEQNHAG